MTARRLNSKQKRYIKQLSHPLKPLMQMGKEGASPKFIEELLDQISHHEVLKIRILNNCSWEKERIEEVLAEAGITLVQKVGHVLTVYMEMEDSELQLPG